MKIILFDQTFLCNNEIKAVDQLFEQLVQSLTETGQGIGCLEVDGVEVYTDFEQYITEHLSSIEVIIIKIKTEKELLDDTLSSVRNYLARAIPEIDKLVDHFYQGVTSETWNTFAQLLDGLQYIMECLDVVTFHNDWYLNAEQFAHAKENLSQKIIMLQNAAESQDRVWLSDVLLYEIIPFFKSLNIIIDLNISKNVVH